MNYRATLFPRMSWRVLIKIASNQSKQWGNYHQGNHLYFVDIDNDNIIIQLTEKGG